MEIASPGKINLTLDIKGLGADGFHEIESVMQTFDFCDYLQFTLEDEGLRMSCSQVDPADLFLIRRAYETFLEATGKAPGVTVRVEKHLPLASGLGGGSSNAAKTLLAMNELTGYPASQEELVDMAKSIGSDVPFFLYGTRALATGRGTRITMLRPSRLGALLIVNDGTRMRSADVYRRYDEMGETYPPHTDGFLKALENDEDLKPHLGNHLEEAGFSLSPHLVELRDRLLEAGAEVAHLAGSGGSLYGIFEDIKAARAARGFFVKEFTAVMEW